MTDRKDIRDYFVASMENDSLIMEPHCGKCDAHLEEDYYCEKCRRNCLCLDIYCEAEDVYEKVSNFIRIQPRFKKFKAFLRKKEQNA